MNPRKKAGIALMVIGSGLLVLAIIMVGSNLAAAGPIARKITSYRPPFTNHGLLTVLAGIASVISFLTGTLLTALGNHE